MRTSRRTSGERQVKPRRKFVNLKVIYRNITKTVIPKMKTKRKEKEKTKKRKQKKRTGKGSVWNRTQDLRRTRRKLYHKATRNTQKTWSKFYYYHLRALIKVSSKIFFRRMTAVWPLKTQRKCISSNLHVENGSPTV